MRTGVVSRISVDLLFDRACGQIQSLTPRGGFEGFQINAIRGTPPQQRIDLSGDVAGQ